MTARVLGALLAGGRSRRFGSDKAMALLDGKPLIEHALGALAAQVDGVIICGRAHPGFETVADRPAPGLGPLGALNAALHAGAAAGYSDVLTAGCDMPWLPPGLVALLADAPAVLAGDWLVGRWPTRLAGALDAYLAAQPDRSMRGWMAAAAAREVAAGVRVPNLNTPDELRRFAEAQASVRTPGSRS